MRSTQPHACPPAPARAEQVQTFSDALANRQFRILDLRAEPSGPGGGGNLRAGRLLYRLSHEVRSSAHPNFLRPLFSRGDQ